jgi:hypothetical protein
MKLARRSGGSALDVADTALAVVVGIVAIMAVFWVVSWILGTFMFIVKLAIVGLVIAGVISLVSRFKSS